MKKLRRSVSLLLFAAATLTAADTAFYIAPCTDPATGCEPGDLDLARWALQSWQAASQGSLHFVETKEESKALFRFVWASPTAGLYGETVAIDVNGQRGAQIY